jgi:hypothetical protein
MLCLSHNRVIVLFRRKLILTLDKASLTADIAKVVASG